MQYHLDDDLTIGILWIFYVIFTSFSNYFNTLKKNCLFILVKALNFFIRTSARSDANITKQNQVIRQIKHRISQVKICITCHRFLLGWYRNFQLIRHLIQFLICHIHYNIYFNMFRVGLKYRYWVWPMVCDEGLRMRYRIWNIRNDVSIEF